MKRVVIVLTLLVSLVAVSVGAAQAQGSQAPGTWGSSINIQNVGDEDAMVVIEFYDAAGDLSLSFTVDPVIPAGGSRSLYVPTDVAGLSDGQYSSVVSSNQPLQVVANASSTSPSTTGAYNGIDASELATKLYFPGAYNNYFGFYSELVIQNSDADTADVTLRFYDDLGAEADVVNDTIAGTASKVFVLEDVTTAAGRYSVEVESTNEKDLVGVANHWTAALYGEFSNYNAFVGGTTLANAPSLVNDYYGFVSSLTVQNVDTSDADVLITYSNGVTESVTLEPRTSEEYYQPDNTSLPSGDVDGIFSAKVETTNDTTIVAIVNQEDKTKGSLASYNAPSTSSTEINCPVTMKSFYGWFSAVTVQNVGVVDTDVTLTFASGEVDQATGVPPNGTANFIQLTGQSNLPDGSSVSAVVTSSGEPIVAIVNENSNDRYATTPGDYLAAYTATAQ
jgi:hypothetical protein